MKIGDLIEIEWDDHFSHGAGWMDVEEVQTGAEKCRSVGYIIGLTKTVVILAPTKDISNKTVSGAQGRLRNNITKLKILKGLR